MFSPPSSAADIHVYDFKSEANAQKWNGLLKDALSKVARQVYPSLGVKDDALDYIEDLILQLLGMLIASQPHTVQDVEDRVQKNFPHPIDKWAITDALKALKEGKKKSPLVLPVDKIHPLLVKDVLGYKIEIQVTMYIVAVLEYIAADILKLTGNYVKNIKHQEITCQDIKVAMCADKVLMDMFFQDDDPSLAVEEEPSYIRRGSLLYEEIVKDLVLEEMQYVRDLNMIIKVFRQPFVRLFPRSKDLEVIFSNIIDVHEFTVRLLSSLEDTLEMTAEDSKPLVGGCFEELAEGAEFDVYEKYADDMLKPYGRERLNALLQRPDVMHTFVTLGHGFKESVKYVLPKLLLGPIYHCLQYFDVIKALIDTTECEDDRESLVQTHGVLYQLKVDIERKLGPTMQKRKLSELSLRFQGRGDRESAITKLRELQKNIDGWEAKDMSQTCNKFIMEGVLYKYTGKRFTERYVFLFDAMMILTKQNTKRSSVSGPMGDYKLKEKFNMRKVDVSDKEDSETTEMKHAFELIIRDQPNLTLAAKTAEDKNNWMAALLSLFTRSMLERLLDSVLAEEERQQPLRLPSPEEYRFAVEDSDENIVLEDNQEPGMESPLIKGGTLLKLVERLTFHRYADPKFVQTFLTTYRDFCKSDDLLDLLVERFNMPDPPMLESSEEDLDLSGAVRDDLKRFRREYCKPIQIRVLNVVRHWIDQHPYDFEWNQNLLARLRQFLDTVKGKAMRKCVESIHKAIVRRLESPNPERQITLGKFPPPIEWHLAHNAEDFDIMTLHPVEIARQVTLLEFDLYRAVKPSELVGSVWITKQKNVTSPNLLKMIHHSTMFTFWLEKCIIESKNFEERVAVVSRVLEIMLVFQSLNNLNGVLEVVSALNSAPVFRLRHTFEEMEHKYHKLKKAFHEAKELNSDHFRQYNQKLRSIDPPCVPFLGMYLTNILKLEEGNPDYLPNRPEGLINFSKRRKVAEITQEIQQYQNQPYCLQPEPKHRAFLEGLDPMDGRTEKEFSDYLYGESLDIEPRNGKPAKYDCGRKYSLKSPGIKGRHSSQLRADKSHPSSLGILTAPPTPTFPHALDEDGAASSSGATPPTPTTPLTPPPSDPVFEPVIINDPVRDGGRCPPPPPPPSAGLPPTQSVKEALPQLPPVLPDVPPSPLSSEHGPPTLKPLAFKPRPIHTSSSPVAMPVVGAEGAPPPLPPRVPKPSPCPPPHTPPPCQAPDAPVLPPRNKAPREPPPTPLREAPPVPPRRDMTGPSALPRAKSMNMGVLGTLPVMGGAPVGSAGVVAAGTLPRRNSERQQATATATFGMVPGLLSTATTTATTTTMNMNGSDTPELPPKTYRTAHARKQSS